MVDSYDIVAEAVRKYWKENYPMDVVAFFGQKYDFEPDTAWEWCEEVILSTSSDPDRAEIEFLNDFCEGQTCVKDLRIVPLHEVTGYYTEKHFAEEVDDGKRDNVL